MSDLRLSRWVELVISMLIMAALACTAPGAQQPNTAATVQAVYATITQQANQAFLTATPQPATPVPGQAANPIPATPTQLVLTPTPTARVREIVIGIGSCPGPITVDGKTTDWPDTNTITVLPLDQVTYDPNQEWHGPKDLSGDVRLCWTDASLFMVVQVTDDVHFQTQRGVDSYKGDEVELMFDSDLTGDFYATTWDQDDNQFSLNPGDFGGLVPAPYRYRPAPGQTHGIKMAVRPTGAAANYLLEAEIAWDELGGHPIRGQEYGLCVALSDADHPDKPPQEDTLVTHCAGLVVPNPTTWLQVSFGP